ncbi:hypothetical protein SNEBB_003945 [Seison nebaliae]|nr:hypothetical protein SNEBB_003945 [Seison nebaliae]
MIKLKDTEKTLVDVFRNYIRDEKERILSIEKMVNDKFAIYNHYLQNEQFNFFQHPLNLFHLLRHLTKDFERITELMTKKRGEEYVKSINENILLPVHDDLVGAMVGLVRLQDTYKLSASEMADGDLSKKTYAMKPLSALECAEMGELAYTKNQYDHCMDWSIEALNRLEDERGADIDKPEYLEHKFSYMDYLSFCAAKADNIADAFYLTKHMVNLVPTHERANQNMIAYKEIMKKENIKRDVNALPDLENIYENLRVSLVNFGYKDPTSEKYKALCRGDSDVVQPKSEKIKAKMYCDYFNGHRNPLLIIGPLKREIMFLEPEIVLFHNIISDEEIKELQDYAQPRLSRATVHDVVTGKLVHADYRIQKTYFATNEESSLVAKLSKRIEVATELTMDTAEELQIANYGIGGHYEPHFDFSRKSENPFSDGKGNRVATWMFYMSDVERGGSTVFVPVGARVKPEKGSGIFWHNLYRNGEGKYHTRHAACPVLLGTKWVANKWIRERGQEFRRPCSLNPRL